MSAPVVSQSECLPFSFWPFSKKKVLKKVPATPPRQAVFEPRPVQETRRAALVQIATELTLPTQATEATSEATEATAATEATEATSEAAEATSEAANELEELLDRLEVPRVHRCRYSPCPQVDEKDAEEKRKDPTGLEYILAYLFFGILLIGSSCGFYKWSNSGTPNQQQCPNEGKAWYD